MTHTLGEKRLLHGKRRIWEIDFLRGFCIVLMILDHMMFDFYYLPYMAHNFSAVDNTFFSQMSALAEYYWWDWPVRTVVRYSVVFLFLFMSGISCSLTRSNGGRLRRLSIAAALITIVTVTIDLFADAYLSIVFGILHILVLNILLFLLMKAVWPNPYFYLVTGALITAAGFFLPLFQGVIAPFWKVEIWLERLDWNGFLQVLAGIRLYGSDSYGIFPYTGFFLLGAGAGAIVYREKRSVLPALDGRWNKAYSFVGRHGVMIYLVHQVAVFLLIAACLTAAGYRFF